MHKTRSAVSAERHVISQRHSRTMTPPGTPTSPAAGFCLAAGASCRTLLLAVWIAFALAACADTPGTNAFSFAITCDMRGYVGPEKRGKRYFDGACKALSRVGPGAFMIVPGDCDPIPPVRATLDRYLGADYVWYPVAGNHEVETRADMAWLRNWASNGIPHLSRPGPAGAETTMFAFDYENSHFVVLNNYFDGKTDAGKKAGLATDSLNWLANDLAANKKPLVWIIGHEPLEAQPDMDTARLRHKGGLLVNKPALASRLLEIFARYPISAYLCGHTHNTSAVRVRGIWQLDAGHARGAGDTGAPSTFMKVRVIGSRAWVDIYRADKKGKNYQCRRTLELD